MAKRDLPDEPPSLQTNVGIRAGFIPTDGALARRLKDIRTLWASEWSIPPTRGSLHSRCLLIFDDIPKRK